MEEGRSGHSGTTNKGPTYRLLPSTQTPHSHYLPLPLLHLLPLTALPPSHALHTPPSHYTPLPLTTHPPSHYTPSLPPPYRDPPHSKGGNRTLSCLCTEFQGTAQQTRKSWLIHRSRAACNKQTLAAYNGWLVHRSMR